MEFNLIYLVYFTCTEQLILSLSLPFMAVTQQTLSLSCIHFKLMYTLAPGKSEY